MIYSIIETAKENGLNLFAYLKYLFERPPNAGLDDATLEAVTPWSDELPDACRLRPTKA
ncbi:MAG: transposase domain-containing protein [Firmicutes bacterium]|nr:transposase domain-containing protein [Bacillota bacterium]